MSSDLMLGGGQHFCSVPGCLAHPGCSSRLYHFFTQVSVQKGSSTPEINELTFAVCSDHFNEHNYTALYCSEGNTDSTTKAKNLGSGARLFIPLKPLTVQPAGLINPQSVDLPSISQRAHHDDALHHKLMELDSSSDDTDDASENSSIDPLEIASKVSVVAAEYETREKAISSPQHSIQDEDLDVEEEGRENDGEGGKRRNADIMSYFCTECEYRNQSISMFHGHWLSKHTTEKSFRCTGCSFSANQRATVRNHINKAKKLDILHYDAHSTYSRPIPPHRYRANLRSVALLAGQGPPSTQQGRPGMRKPAQLDPALNKHRFSNPEDDESGPGPSRKPMMIQSDPKEEDETTRPGPVAGEFLSPGHQMEVNPPPRNVEELRREVEDCQKELRELEAAMEEGFRFINDPALVPSSDEEVQSLQAKLVDMREKGNVLAAILSGMETQKKKVIHFLGGGILPASAKEEIRFLQKTSEDLDERLQKGRQLQDSLHQSLNSMRKYFSDLLSSRKEVEELLVLQKERILAHAALKERLASLCFDIQLLDIHRIRKGMLSQLKSRVIE